MSAALLSPRLVWSGYVGPHWYRVVHGMAGRDCLVVEVKSQAAMGETIWYPVTRREADKAIAQAAFLMSVAAEFAIKREATRGGIA